MVKQGKPVQIAPADGKLAVLTPGMGAVSTTFMAGVELVRQGRSRPIGSLTQLGTVRLGKRTEGRSVPVGELVPLAGLGDLVFGGWDLFDVNAYESAKNAGVLNNEDLEAARPFLQTIRPRAGAFDPAYVKNLHATHFKAGTRREQAEAVRQDIREMMAELGASRAVVLWCGSTEVYTTPTAVHESLAAFEKGLDDDDKAINPTQLYAWAALKEGLPFINGAPNRGAEVPALTELALKNRCPIGGSDFKTGQTLIKTVLGPMLKARMLGLRGWYSTNILGNRDGEVLDDPGSFKSKEVSKTSVLSTILQPDQYPDLYSEIYHKVTINYYPPRGDAKEGWDNIDIFGWLGYPMQIKVNFLCRDSILAAPLVLDLALFADLAKRAGLAGIQEWLSVFFKSPITAPGLYPEHDLFIQLTKLKNTLRWMAGEDLITHLGLDYYADGMPG
ncbi:MAG: myo-inositol-1-phosphate synthase [Myxococcales bacterium]